MRRIIQVVATIGLLVSVFWAFKHPNYDSICTAVAMLISVFTSFLLPTKSAANSGQTQEVASGAMGIQAGRDVKINEIKN